MLQGHGPSSTLSNGRVSGQGLEATGSGNGTGAGPGPGPGAPPPPRGPLLPYGLPPFSSPPKKASPSSAGPAGLPQGASPSASAPGPGRGRGAGSAVRIHPQALREKYEALLQTNNRNDRDLRESLKKLRIMVLRDGIPEGVELLPCSLRGRIWKILLGTFKIPSGEYFDLVARGPSPVYEKVKNDTFRTLATDKKFTARVKEDSLSRILNAFVWRCKDRPASRLMNLQFSYVQGMNVLLAPFAYVMPELDAFWAFSQFIQQSCPLYVQPALEGVWFGCKLLDQCLKLVDAPLYNHLKAKNLTAKVYAMPSLLTLSACTQPLSELIQLWDFYLAFGIHLNVLAIVAQVLMLREELLQAESPMKLLRTFPPLQSHKIISMTLSLIPQLPHYLYDLLVRHPYDPTLEDQLEEHASDTESVDSDAEPSQQEPRGRKGPFDLESIFQGHGLSTGEALG